MNTRETQRYLARQERLAKQLELKRAELEIINARRDAKIAVEKAKTEEMGKRTEIINARSDHAKSNSLERIEASKAPRHNRRDWLSLQQSKQDKVRDEQLREIFGDKLDEAISIQEKKDNGNTN